MASLLPMALFLSLSIDTSRGDPQGNTPAGTIGTPTTTKGFSRLYDPNFGYEPYWPGGDWILGVDVPTTLSTASPILICGKDCPENYKNLGKICVMSMDWQHYENEYEECPSNVALKYFHTRWDGGEHMFTGYLDWQKKRCAGKIPITNDYYMSYYTMDSYCEYLSRQCEELPEGNKHYTMFVHLGRCMGVGFAEKDDAPYQGDTWKELFQTHFDWGRHQKRVDFWVESTEAPYPGVRGRLALLKQTPFVPHRWPATTPSTDENEDNIAKSANIGGPPGAVYAAPGATSNNTFIPTGGPPGPKRPAGPPGASPTNRTRIVRSWLREGDSEQEPAALSEVLEAWQDYLRVLR